MNFNELSIDEKVGQRFIFGVNSDDVRVIYDLIKKNAIGGVILYKKNYKNYAEMLNIIKKMKEANKDNNIPLFIGIDQEGGVVNRIPKEIHNLNEIYLTTKKNNKIVPTYAGILSEILCESGINLNFAPVVDIYNDSKSAALESRCFYGDKDEVSRMANEYVIEFNKRNVLPVIKHYPGHGVTRLDSHFFIPYAANYNSVLDKHMVPFDNLIKENIDAIMVGHIRVRKLCGTLPASLNDKFIKTYLREKNKYDGLIISDEVNMLRRSLIYRFIFFDKILKSSNDMILIKLKNNQEGYKILDKYKKLLLSNPLYVKKLDDSVKRIIRVKEKLKVNDNTSFDGVNIDLINKKVDEVNNG